MERTFNVELQGTLWYVGHNMLILESAPALDEILGVEGKRKRVTVSDKHFKGATNTLTTVPKAKRNDTVPEFLAYSFRKGTDKFVYICPNGLMCYFHVNEKPPRRLYIKVED